MHLYTSESVWKQNKETQDRYVDEFINGTDSEDILRARLCGLGLRGDYLASEVHQAVARKADRYPARHRKFISMIMVMERGRQTEYIRFINPESANKAIELLRKQPNVMLASRCTDYPA